MVCLSCAIAQPSLPIPKVRLNAPEGFVLLKWDFGNPNWNTLSNVTTRTVVDSGVFDFYMVKNLPIGVTNTFVVFNEVGLSNMATAVAVPFYDKCSIRVFTFTVTVPSLTNGVTRILTSTNSTIWSTLRTVTNLGPTYSFVWTNDGMARLFRSVSP